MIAHFFASGETTFIFDDKIDFKVAVFGGQCAKDQIQHTASVMKKKTCFQV